MDTQMQAQNAMPAHILAARMFGLSPFMCGSLDAAARRPCAADEYTLDGDRAAYTEGYAEQANEQLVEAAVRLGNMVVCMVGGPEYERLLDNVEYVDSIEDEEWIRRGC